MNANRKGSVTQLRKFFYPSSVVVFGVENRPGNLAKNIVSNCREMGFQGKIFPVGRNPGRVFGREIITDPESLPTGIDLAVILVPAAVVAQTLEICGQKGIGHAIISTGGYREFSDKDNRAEKDLLSVAERYGIRFIGPNCIGVICTNSGLCTPFNPLQTASYRKGPVSIIIQSGGVTTRSSYYFSEEHVGFSKIISAGNKLNIDEIELIEYLINDEDTRQIHMYLESIERGRELIRLAERSEKPIVVFKSNVSRTGAEVARSHTAALSNNDRVVEGALRQAGIIRANDIHDMTVCAKALRLPPLRGNRLVAISLSGGFSVILGDACEKYGFQCPPLPRDLLDQIENFRNPMDFGDVHDIKGLAFTLDRCLALNNIDGLVLSYLYDPGMAEMFGNNMGGPEQVLEFIGKLSEKHKKPIALSFFSERRHIEAFKRINGFPVFNDAVESVRAMRMLRDYWQGRNHTRPA